MFSSKQYLLAPGCVGLGVDAAGEGVLLPPPAVIATGGGISSSLTVLPAFTLRRISVSAWVMKIKCYEYS